MIEPLARETTAALVDGAPVPEDRSMRILEIATALVALVAGIGLALLR